MLFCVRLQDRNADASVGVPFFNITTCVSGPSVASGSNASSKCSGLTDGQYHWQARANDSYNTTGSWLSAGGNPESSPDVIIDTTLSNWHYNRRLNISGSTAGAQTNYQMKLTIYKGNGTDTPGVVYLGGNVKDDFSDLRFTKSDGVTLLDYWIESYTSGVSAVVWVEVDSMPASPGTVNMISGGGSRKLWDNDFGWIRSLTKSYICREL